jgi:hypothetical protein
LLSKGEANSPNLVKYLSGSFLDKLLVGNSGDDHIYIFTPFLQNELPEYIELELDDIAPDKRYIAEDAEVSTNGSFLSVLNPIAKKNAQRMKSLSIFSNVFLN